MRLLAALACVLALSGCSIAPPLLYAGMGLLAGEMQLGSGALNYAAAKLARPPDCTEALIRPCVVVAP